MNTCLNCGYNNESTVNADHPCARCGYAKTADQREADEAKYEAERKDAAAQAQATAEQVKADDKVSLVTEAAPDENVVDLSAGIHATDTSAAAETVQAV